MAQPSFPVVEYPTSGELVPSRNLGLDWKWYSVVSIDLREVSSALSGDGVVTITLCGQRDSHMIGTDYESFMRDWDRARAG